MIEVRMHGRGGQGTVVASKMLADAAFNEGKYVQSYPQFGVERRGAPVTAFTRIGEEGEELFVRSSIYEPHHVVVLDPTLLEAVDVLEGLREGGTVLVNTPEPPERLDIPSKFRVATVDASTIATRWGLGSKAQPIVNTAILGAFARVTGIVQLETLLNTIREEAPLKPEENAKAARDAYNEVRMLKQPEEWEVSHD